MSLLRETSIFTDFFMKTFSIVASLLLAVSAHSAYAKDGYRIQVNFKNTKDTLVYLAHYYGKPLPTIYKTDSARIDKNGVANFSSKDKLLGGIYMMLLSDMKTYFEVLLDNGDDMSITADVSKLPDGIMFKNTPENERFQQYFAFLKGFSAEQQALQTDMAAAKNAKDSAKVRERMAAKGKELITYRRNHAKQYPNTLLTSIFGSLEVPEIPEGKHYNADGSVDTNFAYKYYKAHFWEHFNFKDDRLIHAPVYDAKLDEYFNKLVPPLEDSVIKEADWILAQTKGQKELFKYSLWWITRYVEESKIMGMDRVFVYLVENYYMKGDAYWLQQEDLSKFYDRASKIAPNLIGRVAPEIKMKDVNGKLQTLSAIKAKYTLVVFWDPTCGHCMKEIPQIDSLYQAELKKKGVKVFAVKTESEEKQWTDFIKKHKLDEWTHVHDPEHQSNYRSMYDVYSTPVVYLLDEKKIIRGKRIDHTNIMNVIEMLARKEKQGKTNP